MKTKIFVVSQKSWDNHEPDYIFPYFYHTREDAIENAKARTIKVGELDWKENYGIEIFWLADMALKSSGETK
jgi:hypothetical protein